MSTAEITALAARLAEWLEGTADRTIEGGLEALGLDPNLEDDGDFLSALDTLIFSCETCGWWCGNDRGRYDTAAGWNCDDCTEREAREED